MPCDSVQTCSVDLRNITSIDLLADALREEFGSSNVRRYGDALIVNIRGEQVRIEGGQATTRRGAEALADEINRAYTRKVVRTAAQRFGWQVKETKPKRQYELARR